MSHISKFVIAIVGLLVMAIVASRQLFLFAEFRDSQGFFDSQGGRYHLWFALIAGVAACIAGSLMFYFFHLYERNKWSKVLLAPVFGPPLILVNDTRPTKLPRPVPFDPVRWALANSWLTEGQADDRMPMDGSVTVSGETPSGQRAFARRSHQLGFKKWSRERHD